MDAKYIVFESPKNGEFPVVFPPYVKHSMIAEAMLAKYPGVKPIRAAFTCVDDNGVFSCYGESTSLKLGGGGTADEILINVMFGTLEKWQEQQEVK